MEEDDRTTDRGGGAAGGDGERTETTRRQRKFVITCTARATIRESWFYEAEDEHAAMEAFERGTPGFLIEDAILGDETERLFLRIEPVDRHPRATR